MSVTDIRTKRTYECCPVCGCESVKCLADPPGSWDIVHIECADCGVPIFVADLPSDEEPYP